MKIPETRLHQGEATARVVAYLVRPENAGGCGIPLKKLESDPKLVKDYTDMVVHAEKELKMPFPFPNENMRNTFKTTPTFKTIMPN